MSDQDIDFPPHVLREYSLIADGSRGALIGPRGEIAWMCAPFWHSEAVFASLIGGGGVYAIAPAERYVWGGYYEQGSLIWRSRWATGNGIIESRDAMAFPSDGSGTAVILRRVVACDADARVNVVLDPRAGYGTKGFGRISSDGNGLWTGRTGGLHIRWQAGPASVREAGSSSHHRLEATLDVPAGSHHDLVLEISDRPFDGDPVNADRAWRATEDSWGRAVPTMEGTLTPADCRTSYAVLRGLTSPGGGMVAAATTSLPERAEEGRNYDYRYVWIRDQCFAGHAAAAVGDEDLLVAAVRFVGDRLLAEGSRMAPAYTIDGDPVPNQTELGLPGYPGGFDRIGNWVNQQFQLDAFGESLVLLAEAESKGVLDRHGWEAVEAAAAAIAERWQEPDAGIWEIDNRPWTHSRLMAAAGLRAAAAVAPGGSPDWIALSDRILADTSAKALHTGGYWVRSPDDDGLDGALLIPPLRGLPAHDDPRTRATLDAYLAALTEDGYAYRFRQRAGTLADAEGSFSLCGFATAMALGQAGRTVDALRWFERIKAATGPPMLYSEEFDVVQHQLRGNIPQAFVHAIMIEAAARLAALC